MVASRGDDRAAETRQATRSSERLRTRCRKRRSRHQSRPASQKRARLQRRHRPATQARRTISRRTAPENRAKRAAGSRDFRSQKHPQNPRRTRRDRSPRRSAWHATGRGARRAASFSRPMSEPRPALRAGDHRQRQTGKRNRACFARSRTRSRRLEAQRSPLARRARRAQHRRQLHDGGHSARRRRRDLRPPALEGSRIKIRSTRS